MALRGAMTQVNRDESMKLRLRCFLMDATLLGVFLLGLFILTRFVIWEGLLQIDIQRTQQISERIVHRLNDEQRSIEQKSGDWAAWHDAAMFTQGKDPLFVRNQITKEVFRELNLDFMAFLDKKGELIWGVRFDSAVNSFFPLPGGLVEKLHQGIPFKDFLSDPKSKLQGLLGLQAGLAIVSFRPVYDPLTHEPPSGALIMGRFLDEAVQRRIMAQENFPIKIQSIGENVEVPQEIFDIQHVSGVTIAKRILLDLKGTPIAILTIEVPDIVTPAGRSILRVFEVGLLLLGLAFILTHQLFLNRTVLSRVRRLGESLGEIGKEDLGARVPLEGQDEIASLAQDINAMLEALEKAERARVRTERLAVLYEHNTLTANALVQEGKIGFCNRTFLELFGFSSEKEAIGFPFDKLFDDTAAYEALMEGLESEGTATLADIGLRARDGSRRVVMARFVALKEPNQDNFEVEAFFVDVTGLKQAQERLDKAYRYFKTIFNTASEMLVVFDPDGRVRDVNRAAELLFGYGKEEIMSPDFDWRRCVHPDDLPSILKAIDEVQKDNVYRRLEVRGIKKDGSEIVLLASYTPIEALEEGSEGRHILGIHVDITAIKRLESELKYLSFHDALTGLYNRAYFEQELDRLSQGRMAPVAIVVADLDNLKPINDTLGHIKGDELLKRTARILREVFRAEDIIARLGGDEFGVILVKANNEALEGAIKRLQKAIEKDNGTGSKIELSLSAGYAIAEETPFEPGALFRAADQAMYRTKLAKKHGLTNGRRSAFMQRLSEEQSGQGSELPQDPQPKE